MYYNERQNWSAEAKTEGADGAKCRVRENIGVAGF